MADMIDVGAVNARKRFNSVLETDSAICVIRNQNENDGN